MPRATFSEGSATPGEIVYRYIKAVGKGILKVMSKMGISTYQSYCGAQIFDAIGLQSAFVDKYFFGTATMIEGVGLEEIATETVARHTAAFGRDPLLASTLDIGGEYAFRMRGESHAWTPDAVAALQHAVRGNAEDHYREFSEMVNTTALRMNTIRGLFKVKSADRARPQAGIDRRGRTGCRYRQALLDGCDVLRLDQPRGARRRSQSP